MFYIREYSHKNPEISATAIKILKFFANITQYLLY